MMRIKKQMLSDSMEMMIRIHSNSMEMARGIQMKMQSNSMEMMTRMQSNLMEMVMRM